VSPSPAELGYRMPAEWEPHAATWLAWPHNPTDWPGKLEPIHWVYGEIVRKLAPGERVRLLVHSPRIERRARRVLRQAGVELKRVEFLRWPTNRGWTRDCGPIFVTDSHPPRGAAGSAPTEQVRKAILRFRFNAWARYPDWRLDNQVPERAARKFRRPLFPVPRPDDPRKLFVLEGGAIDVNGCGTVLTTEECLLDQKKQARNPGLPRAAVEQVLRDSLGVSKVLWLGHGIAGDDTHGHVDDLCRFVNRSTVVLCRETNPRDANYRALEENWERIRSLRLEDGSRIEAVPLPMPAPLYFDGVRLPASYANFYIGNAAVIVPTFNDPADRTALGTLVELFPDRPVVGIHAVDLVWGFGTLHCLSQQEPA
jgi:agmatine deiminase